MQPIQQPSMGPSLHWDGQRWVQGRPRGTAGRALVVFVAVVLVLALVVATRRSHLAASLTARDTTVATGAPPTVPPSSGRTLPTTAPATTASRTAPTIEPASTLPREAGTTQAGTTGAVDPEAALADSNVFVSLLPALQSEPAPPWVHQGTRITYYAAAASVPGSYHEYVEDENGVWEDPETGKRYSQTDIPGAAGHGYTQVNVTKLNPAVAVLSIRSYGLTDLALTSPVTTLTWGGAVGLPGAGSDYWLHPDALASVQDVVSPSLKVLRMPYTIDGTSYRSIWIQSIGDDANLTWVYDLDSGVLLHTASSSTGPPIGGPVAPGDSRTGSTFLTQSTLVSIRQTALPWASGDPPSWLGTVSHLDYAGQVSVAVAGTAPIVLPASLAVDRLVVGNGWVRYRFARTLSSTVAPSVTEYMERIDGPAQVAALWVPPAGLSGLTAGQELDRDPVTNAVVTVAAVDWGGSNPTVTIHEAGPGEESELVYDATTGLLISSVSTDLHLGTRSELQFTGWS